MQTYTNGVAKHRAKQIAMGKATLNIYLPAKLLAEYKRLKEERGLRGYAPVIEEAMRLYLEKQATKNQRT